MLNDLDFCFGNVISECGVNYFYSELNMSTLLSISYILSGLGVVLCIVAYFVVPKMLRSALSDESSDSSSDGSDSED